MPFTNIRSIEEYNLLTKAQEIAKSPVAVADLLAEIESLKAQIKERDNTIQDLRAGITTLENYIIELRE
jgi:peptidoglycan hydrolase CwlO-like protein